MSLASAAARPRAYGVVLLCLALPLAAAVAVAVGAVSYEPRVVVQALLHPNAGSEAAAIVWALRLPRVLIAALVGGALALAGALMQGMLRNPLVDPYLTGGSAGAAFAIAIAIALGVAPPLFAALAFAAALGTTFAVASLARSGRGIAPERLILAGIAVSSLFAGMTTLLIMLAPSASVSLSILAWLGGSLVGHGWSDLAWAGAYAGAGTVCAISAIPALNAIRLGDARAAALGVDLERTRWIVLIAASLLTAAAVSVSGVIGFVGLIVPHAVRALCGADARWSIPACIPAGATVVVLADTVARTLAPPQELPVGVLLSLLGVPAFLYIAFRRRQTPA